MLHKFWALRIFYKYLIVGAGTEIRSGQILIFLFYRINW